ncbi:MAG: SDR family oxidoreductase [Planctomycetaceae bacterium]|nr:SDR family oxidoreductase [Planctomycetaceae bacterium]
METHPRRMLIFGCGYLGQRVAARWQIAGGAVSAVTRSETRAEEFARRGWQPVIADICDPGALERLPVADVTLFAVGYDRSSGKSQREVYVDGLRHVLNRMASQCPQFLYVSSSSVYGQQGGEWVDEDSACEPTQPGGQCCLEAERLVLDAYSAAGCAAQVLRLSGIYGPDRLLSRVDALRRQEPLSGSPESWLNLIQVDDAATAVLACAERQVAGRVYLVSDDEPVLRGEYYRHLATLIDAPPPEFDASQPARRGAGGLNKRCRNTRMKYELGVALQFPSFRVGLSAALPMQG